MLRKICFHELTFSFVCRVMRDYERTKDKIEPFNSVRKSEDPKTPGVFQVFLRHRKNSVKCREYEARLNTLMN